MSPTPPPELAGLLAQAAALHDHLCPRQVLGVRMGLYAGRLLGLELPQMDKRLYTFVETDGCFADGVSVATGCWLGRRTMRLVDLGRVAATFVDTRDGRAAIRMRPHVHTRELAPRYAPAAPSRWHAYLEAYQVMPDDELLDARPVALAADIQQLISRPDARVICARCGEEIINQREVERAGRVLCRSCAGDVVYYGDG